MKITFFGAAEAVTGSKHVIETNGYKILLDCGLHQGHRLEAYNLNKTLPFDALSLQTVLLSHAHADHCGTLPLLIKNGYSGKIQATPTTIDISRLIMLDSAKLQASDYEHLQAEGIPEAELLPPLYSIQDVETTASHFRPVEYVRLTKAWEPLNETTRFKFYDAGHILGSAVTVIETEEAGATNHLLFTGDLGNGGVPILHDPEEIIEPINVIIMECTYGDRLHRPITEVDNLLVEIISKAVTEKRKIIVPAFALGRTQELIYILHRLYNEGKIPAIPIYIDSPLSNSITEVFKNHQNDFDEQTQKDFINNHESPFVFANLKYVSSGEESKALNKMEGPFMVIASSGMAEGGRILHHLEHTVWDPKATIILAGYQAEHTLGRKIQEGHSHVPIFGKMHELKAEVITIDEFSAHADQKGLFEYVSKLEDLKKVFLVHGEVKAAQAFKAVLNERLPALEVTIPKPGEQFTI